MSSEKTGHVVTLANSIIGVAILSMPFCFQKCGILLSIFLLSIINITTRICCHYLIKTSILTRRKSMETISHHLFGAAGKLLVELCTIGFLLGTCVAYYVVVGDIGPQIIAKHLELERTESLRICVMLIVTVICVLPLGLLKNVDSLATVCMASIGFYCCLVLTVMSEAQEHVLNGDWVNHVYWWRWSGVLQCLPIFSLSLSCQMVVFEVYESMQNATLHHMNEIVKSAISMCTLVYVMVGAFGYVAFCRHEFSGNILLNLEPSMTSDVINIGFVLSVAFSFPLVIFPCRASLYSLLYRRGHSEVAHYIPEHRFRLITISIIVVSLVIGILLPSIELIIGLVGSTIGVAICVIFPASCFISAGKKNSGEVMVAKSLVVFGFVLMVLGTYANLNAIDDKSSAGEVLRSDRPFYQIEHLHIDSENLEESVEITTITDVRNVTEYLQKPPKLIVEPVNIPKHKINNVVEAKPILEVRSETKPRTAVSGQAADINREAILHEDAEIAAEAKITQDDDELQRAHKLVKEIKEELVKKQQETENLVMQKLDVLAEHIEHIEKVQENELSKSQHHQDEVENVQRNDIKVLSSAQQATQSKAKPVLSEVVQSLDEKPLVLSPQLEDPILTRLEAAVASHKREVRDKLVAQDTPAMTAGKTAPQVILSQDTQINDKDNVREIQLEDNLSVHDRASVRDILNVKENQTEPNNNV